MMNTKIDSSHPNWTSLTTNQEFVVDAEQNTGKVKKTAIRVIEKYTLRVKENTKKHNLPAPSMPVSSQIAPSQEYTGRCEKCKRLMSKSDLRKHKRLNNCDLYLGNSDPIDGSSSSIRAMSGGLPSLGKRAR